MLCDLPANETEEGLRALLAERDRTEEVYEFVKMPIHWTFDMGQLPDHRLAPDAGGWKKASPATQKALRNKEDELFLADVLPNASYKYRRFHCRTCELHELMLFMHCKSEHPHVLFRKVEKIDPFVLEVKDSPNAFVLKKIVSVKDSKGVWVCEGEYPANMPPKVRDIIAKLRGLSFTTSVAITMLDTQGTFMHPSRNCFLKDNSSTLPVQQLA